MEICQTLMKLKNDAKTEWKKVWDPLKNDFWRFGSGRAHPSFVTEFLLMLMAQ